MTVRNAVHAKILAMSGETFSNSVKPTAASPVAMGMRQSIGWLLNTVRLRIVTVPVARTYPLADAPAAYEHFQRGGKLGKIVLTMD